LYVLLANFRNTHRVTESANGLLKVKQACFGSVDRESNFLVQSTSGEEGDVSLVPAKDAAPKALDKATRASVQHTVTVLRDENEAAAREQFRTPPLFSVHEAEGVKYPHVVLFNLVSGGSAPPTPKSRPRGFPAALPGALDTVGSTAHRRSWAVAPLATPGLDHFGHRARWLV
jgi:hypothetical protein